MPCFLTYALAFVILDLDHIINPEQMNSVLDAGRSGVQLRYHAKASCEMEMVHNATKYCSIWPLFDLDEFASSLVW